MRSETRRSHYSKPTTPSSVGEPRGEKTLTLTIPLPWPMLTINVRNNMHWRMRSVHAQAQRETAKYSAYEQHRHPMSGAPYFSGPVRVDIEIRPYPRQRECDPTAAWEAMKTVLDGLEDANLVGNDKQFTIGTMVWNKSIRAGLLILTLTAAG